MTKEKGFTIATLFFIGGILWILVIFGFLITIAVSHLNPLPVQDVDSGYVKNIPVENDFIITLPTLPPYNTASSSNFQLDYGDYFPGVGAAGRIDFSIKPAFPGNQFSLTSTSLEDYLNTWPKVFTISASTSCSFKTHATSTVITCYN